jgi:hypothetical protein
MSDRDQSGRSESALLIFPEIIAVAAATIVTPIILIGVLRSGKTLVGGIGLIAWLFATGLCVRYLCRRQYALALLPMIVILGICLLIFHAAG